MIPLTPAELLAAQQAQEARVNALRVRGWQRHVPFTRSDVADWTLDRWELRNNTRRVN